MGMPNVHVMCVSLVHTFRYLRRKDHGSERLEAHEDEDVWIKEVESI
jgi:hypothetical protein